jgi:hypothetical protein
MRALSLLPFAVFVFPVHSHPLSIKDRIAQLFHHQPLDPDSSGWPFNIGGGLTFGSGWAWGDSEIIVVDHEPSVAFSSRAAAFGSRISNIPGLLGYLVPLNSFTHPCNSTSVDKSNEACPPLCLNDDGSRPGKNESWIALVQRGGCPFAPKVREGQRWGARAVVVGGSTVSDDGKDDLVTMYSKGTLPCLLRGLFLHR